MRACPECGADLPSFEPHARNCQTRVELHARILLREVNEALARGTRHFNKDGALLTTPKQIIETMLAEGGVTFQPNES
jgi:hypothetical protein